VVEHFLGKEEVKSSILFNGSLKAWLRKKCKSRIRIIESIILKTQIKN
jgi:hypothetical protein